MVGDEWLVMGEMGRGFFGSFWFCFRVEVGWWFGRRRGAEGWRSGRRLGGVAFGSLFARP